MHPAYFGRTDSHTLGSLAEGHIYFVEAQATMTARRTNDKLTLQDKVTIDEHQRISSGDFADD